MGVMSFLWLVEYLGFSEFIVEMFFSCKDFWYLVGVGVEVRR